MAGRFDQANVLEPDAPHLFDRPFRAPAHVRCMLRKRADAWDGKVVLELVNVTIAMRVDEVDDLSHKKKVLKVLIVLKVLMVLVLMVLVVLVLLKMVETADMAFSMYCRIRTDSVRFERPLLRIGANATRHNSCEPLDAWEHGIIES
jgi:hypothetical protein